MGASNVKGWAAAATHVGTTSGKLRRLAKAGKLKSNIENNAHIFELAELERVREQIQAAGDLDAHASRRPTVDVPACDTSTPMTDHHDEVSVPARGYAVATKLETYTDDEIVEIRRASLLEQAEAERLQAATTRVAAEIAHARAVRERDELLREAQERKRNQRVGEIVNATVSTVFPVEQPRVEQLLRRRLQGVEDLDNRVALAAVITRAVGDVRAQLASERRMTEERADVARRENAEAHAAQLARARAAESQAIALRHAERARRIAAIITDVARELQNMGLDPQSIAFALASAKHQLEALDQQALNGVAWPAQVARWHASAALGFQPPEIPVVWDARCGWRWLQPGE